MNRYTFERAIILKLTQQGCVHDKVFSTQYTLVFTHPTKGSFNIPRPTRDEGWGLSQLNYIEQLLEAWGFDFLPLDYL